MAEQFNFTTKKLDEIKPPASGRIEYQDKTQPKLRLRVTSTGIKTFSCFKRDSNGKLQRQTIGRYPDVGVKVARDLTRDILSDIAKGVDIRVKRDKAKKQSITLQELFDGYIDRTDLKPGTVKDYRKKFRRFDDWKDKPVSAITETMVLSRHKALTKIGERTCNNAMRLLRALMKYANVNGYIDSVPTDVIANRKRWHTDKRKVDIIPESELKDWYQAVLDLEDSRSKVAMLMMIHTGLRVGELLKLRWLDIDLEAKALTTPDPKNKEPVILPIPAVLIPYLQSLQGKGEWVFPSVIDSSRPMAEISRSAAAKVTAATGKQYDNHTLRRTFLTLSEAVGNPLLTTKRLANHVTRNDVTGGYINLEIGSLRKATEKISAFIVAKVESGKVVQFPGVTNENA